ncbi:EKC/KEOPS complex subunit TPRKB [Hypomesus transpacificus]|uniref:EKC/KEOPS complex subunit TPRKB n=1 Tax=Hypomesus transpacificus TaxID=137520 RepID=UPI001F07C083|nr:EKC/KEOPS complex subunit TPRKB [Hypomesus transpacificus]
MMHLSQQLELFPEFTVTQLLFKDVKNAVDLRKNAVDGLIKGALINPTMIVDPFQVLIATNKAVHLHKIGKMKTKSLYSEIIFNLLPTNSISEAFKRFGVSDRDECVLVVLVHEGEDAQLLADVVAMVAGQQMPVEHVSSLTDSANIKKLYKVPPQECGSLLDAVVCRMATKDVMQN